MRLERGGREKDKRQREEENGVGVGQTGGRDKEIRVRCWGRERHD